MTKLRKIIRDIVRQQIAYANKLKLQPEIASVKKRENIFTHPKKKIQ